MASSDPYKVLGVEQEGVAGRDQEGLPQARPPVPPGPQPGRREGRGALQGDPGRPTTSWATPRSARSTTAAAFGPCGGARPAAGGGVQLRRGRVRRHPLRPVRRGGGAGGAARRRRGAASAGRGPSAAATSRPRSRISFDQAIEGAQVPLVVPTPSAARTCRGTGAKPGTSPTVCPRCQGRGVESQGQGLFSISQPCSRCGGSGAVIEDPCPTCQRRGPLRTVKRYRVEHPRRRARRAAASGSPARASPGRAAARPATCSSSPTSTAPRSSQRKGDNLEVEVPLTIPEALPRRRDRGADAQRAARSCASRAGTKHGTVQRLRGEGPPKLGGTRPRGDIHYRFVDRRPAHALSRAARGGRRAVEGHERRPAREAVRDARGAAMAHRRTRITASSRRRPRRLHDLGRRRAGRDASADAAHVRAARADRAQALAEGHAAVLARPTSSACAASRR